MENWLRSIELGDHYPAFRHQGITIDQVADLTDEDLRELGLSIGDRKRFRRAVASLAPSGAALGAPLVIERTRAERRPLTIMFVDLVNSSELGDRLEAEDLLETIRSYREFCGGPDPTRRGHDRTADRRRHPCLFLLSCCDRERSRARGARGA